MRILVVSSLLPTPDHPKIIGGAEVVARKLATVMAERGHDLHVVRSMPQGSQVPTESTDGLVVDSIPIRRPFWPFDGRQHNNLAKLLWHARDDLGDSADIATAIRKFDPHVIHTHNIVGLSTGVWRAAAAAGKPVVHTLHDYYLMCVRSSRFRSGGICASPCTDCRLLTNRRRADTRLVGDVVGVSGKVLGVQRDNGLFAAARAHVIPNIIDASYAADPKPSPDVPTFGFLGRIAEEKGVYELARAFGAMSHPARLRIGGRIDPATQDHLRSLAGGRAIDFLGFVKPDAFLASIDVLVVPSIWDDPLPTVILEGQTAGVPTIGSRHGGIVEAIGSEDAGWSYDSANPDALRALLDLVAGAPGAIAAKAAAARAASARFTQDRVAAAYGAVYARAAEQAGG